MQQTLRGLGRPCVIFTATPFRNDARYFEVDPGDSFRYTLSQAISDEHLRTPRFAALPRTSASDFGQALMSFVDEMLDPADRIIVRCATLEGVAEVTNFLRKSGASAIGIHERFREPERAKGLFRRVPEKHEARFWVHQNKLIEGIDNSTFRCVALLDPPGSHRALVQQIGRVLRGRASNPEAWVLAERPLALQSAWSRFLEFNESVDPTGQPILEALRQISDSHVYWSGRFRNEFNPDSFEEDELRVPRSVRVFRSPAHPDESALDRITAAHDKELRNQDGEALTSWRRGQADSGASWALTLVALPRQSRFLDESFLPDVEIGLSIFVQLQDRIYIQSAVGLDLREMGYRSATAKELRLAFGSSGNRFTQVTLRNTDLSPTAERSRHQSAASIQDLGPDLGDYMKSPSTITGIAGSVDIVGEEVDRSRYVGFDRARVRESGLIPLAGYLQWIGKLHEALVKDELPAPIFDRFAEVVDCTAPVAVNFLLDYLEASDSYTDVQTGESLELEDEALEVLADTVTLRGTTPTDQFEATIRWDGERARYDFSSDELDKRYENARRPGLTFSADLTERQGFRLIVHEADDESTLLQYVDSSFVRPRVNLSLDGAVGVDLERLLVTDEFDGVTSEKGTVVDGDDWIRGSLFEYICRSVLVDKRLFGQTFSENVLVVCDDDGREQADFFLWDEANARLVMVHAKHGRTLPGAGAAGLHEVVAQAQKHLRTVAPGGRGFRSAQMAARWSNPWRQPFGEVTRVRSFPRDPQGAASAIYEALRDPNVERQVLIAASSILSREAFLASARSNTPHALQALYLLQGAWSAVSAVGARLRVAINP